jgi:hypothetical protein
MDSYTMQQDVELWDPSEEGVQEEPLRHFGVIGSVRKQGSVYTTMTRSGQDHHNEHKNG